MLWDVGGITALPNNHSSGTLGCLMCNAHFVTGFVTKTSSTSLNDLS
jgi:hypothetical protein